MMKLVPPTGWGDVATRRDLDLLEMRLRTDLATEIGRVDVEIAGLRTEFADFRAEISDRLRTQTIAMSTLFLGGMGMAVSIAVGVNRLLG